MYRKFQFGIINFFFFLNDNEIIKLYSKWYHTRRVLHRKVAILDHGPAS